MFDHIPFAYIVASILLRYLVIAGIAYGLFYYWQRTKWYHRKIQPHFPKPAIVRQEFLYSLTAVVIFAVVVHLVYTDPVKKYTKVYTNIHDHSMGYFFISVVSCIVMHDTYFYWSHRLMHWKKIFRYVHHIHHKSHNPTPWAAFSFHPVESLVEAGIVPLAAFTMPIHPLAFSLFGLYMIIMNVLGHLGYELFPAGMLKNKWLNWHNTSTHHNMHHHYSKCNYGLYFNIWDRIMKTNHIRYEETFEKAASGQQALAINQKSSIIYKTE
ncbi:sterol desaturase family protein [Niastella yeongjuensis]|nr:sterol desaturase family protein [Niastella yeongjuensis]SEP20674.1 Fatty acid hydroxylase superfamily protein [Niastella yeongjuensis]